MEFDKQQILDLIKQQGGDHERAAQHLPDKVDHSEHSDLLQKFGVNPSDLVAKFGGSIPGL